MKIGERASLLYERAAMELTSLVSGMTEFAANLYPLKTEEELVALLSGMHHFPPGVPERARRVHERLPAGSALCSSDVGVLIDRLDTEGGLDGLHKHLAHTKEDLYISFRAPTRRPRSRRVEPPSRPARVAPLSHVQHALKSA